MTKKLLTVMVIVSMCITNCLGFGSGLAIADEVMEEVPLLLIEEDESSNSDDTDSVSISEEIVNEDSDPVRLAGNEDNDQNFIVSEIVVNTLYLEYGVNIIRGQATKLPVVDIYDDINSKFYQNDDETKLFYIYDYDYNLLSVYGQIDISINWPQWDGSNYYENVEATILGQLCYFDIVAVGNLSDDVWDDETESSTAPEEIPTETTTVEETTTEPATEETTTEAPTEPATEETTTEAPTTETQPETTTEEVTTEEPATEAVTEEATTEAPTTEAPTEPATEETTTEEPTTEAPTESALHIISASVEEVNLITGENLIDGVVTYGFPVITLICDNYEVYSNEDGDNVFYLGYLADGEFIKGDSSRVLDISVSWGNPAAFVEGETYYGEVSVLGNRYPFAINVATNMIREIIVNDTYAHYYSMVEENGLEYRVFEPYITGTIILSNGTQINFGTSADKRMLIYGKVQTLKINTHQSAQSVWQPGNTYTVTVSMSGVSGSGNVAVTNSVSPTQENILTIKPVRAIVNNLQITDYDELKHNSDGSKTVVGALPTITLFTNYYVYKNINADYWFFNGIFDDMEMDIDDIDANTPLEWGSASHCYFEVDWGDTSSWTSGNTYTATVSILNHTYSFNVEVLPGESDEVVTRKHSGTSPGTKEEDTTTTTEAETTTEEATEPETQPATEPETQPATEPETTTVPEPETPASYMITIVPDDHANIKVEKTDALSIYLGESEVHDGDYVEAGTVLRVTRTPNFGYFLLEGYASVENITINSATSISAPTGVMNYNITVRYENGVDEPVESTMVLAYDTQLALNAANKPASWSSDQYEFVGWYQENGKLVSANSTYTASIYTEMVYVCKHQKTSGVVTFVANNQIKGTFTGDVFTDEYPDDPSAASGYEFVGWDKTAAEINNALLSKQNITVIALFEPIANNFSVIIYNGEATEPEIRYYTESTLISVKASVVEGKNFAYWEKDGEIMTYNQSVSSTITTNTTLRAIYSEEVTEAIGTATIISADYNPETKKMTLVSYLTVPENSVIVAAGLLASPSTSSKYSSNQELTADNADYVKSLAAAVGKCAPVRYTWIKNGIQIGDVWYTRAYITYIDKNGETKTVYGNRITINAGTAYDPAEKGTASIVESTYDAINCKLKFVSYTTVPDGAIISKSGMVVSSSLNFDGDNIILTAENADYVKNLATAVGKSAPVRYTWIKGSVNIGDIWYVRAYLVYTLDDVEHVIYGNLLKFIVE